MATETTTTAANQSEANASKIMDSEHEESNIHQLDAQAVGPYQDQARWLNEVMVQVDTDEPQMSDSPTSPVAAEGASQRAKSLMV